MAKVSSYADLCEAVKKPLSNAVYNKQKVTIKWQYIKYNWNQQKKVMNCPYSHS